MPTLVKPFNPDDLPAKWIVGIDFGFRGAFAAVLIAWSPLTGAVWVVDSFAMTGSSALYHTQRIHSMCKGLRVRIAWPQDGFQHDRGSGLGIAAQYKAYGANMLSTHAVNHGTKRNDVEPGIMEIRELMYTGRLTIAPHNTELLEEMRHYHKDDNFKIVKTNDHLCDAFRYAVMMKRHGRELNEYDGIGYGPQPHAWRKRRDEPEIARNVDFDVFTGKAFNE